jgi:hypothetical protein
MIQRNVILRADIYEEEDFSPLSSDLPLGDTIADTTVMAWTDAAEHRLAQLQLKKKSKKSVKGAGLALEPLHPIEHVALDLTQLLAARLQYKKSFFLGLLALVGRYVVLDSIVDYRVAYMKIEQDAYS